jgi:hypothetical protein
MAYRWPTDPPGKKPSHSISWAKHQGHLQGTVTGKPQMGLPSSQAPAQAAIADAPGPVGAPPPDPAAIAAEAAAGRNVQYADAQATYDQGRIGRDFGYNAQGAVDPSNPYSRAALLDRNFRQSTLGNTNSYASQGQLYAGSLQNAQNATTFGYLSDSNSLKNQAADAYHQTYSNQLGAYANAGGAVSDAKYNAILKALGQ